ncbi:hypothetical protein XELAEV_18027976mg [Xenopus laevis]|uniref:Uncharacterized protein n=1 Tax=Xenopus laevis TaxID=8355 RepID=A0A974CXD5_XENLA|nr:hypothetical protein XELAEV_18027976mg [Xenopus laevis]
MAVLNSEDSGSCVQRSYNGSHTSTRDQATTESWSGIGHILNLHKAFHCREEEYPCCSSWCYLVNLGPHLIVPSRSRLSSESYPSLATLFHGFQYGSIYIDVICIDLDVALNHHLNGLDLN